MFWLRFLYWAIPYRPIRLYILALAAISVIAGFFYAVFIFSLAAKGPAQHVDANRIHRSSHSQTSHAR